MSRWLQVDFKQMVDEVCRPRCGPSELTILGGQCAESDLLKFLEQWDLAEMPFRAWEYTSEIALIEGKLPQNIPLLERGRIFGEGGDLMLRRSGTVFGWRFVGPAGIKSPTGDYGTRDFWQDHPEVTFHQYNETALLWGEQVGESRVEDRVAAAMLNYPATGRRIQLHYQVFSRAGRVEFVWYRGFSEWEEADYGERND